MIDIVTTERLRRIADRLGTNDNQPSPEIVAICRAELEEIIGTQPIAYGGTSVAITEGQTHTISIPSHMRAPAGVFWSGKEGDEIQRDDEETIFDSDYGAALVVADQCEMPFLVYVGPEDDHPWSLHPFRSPTRAVEWATTAATPDPEPHDPEYKLPAVLVFDTRNQELIEAEDSNGFSGVRLIPDCK